MSGKRIDLSKIEENGAIRQEILKVQARGRMNVIHVIGLPGTGKSWYCLRLAEQLAEDLHGETYKITTRNIVHNLLELLRFIKKIKRPGEIVIGEELGVWLNSKRAMSSENVDASYVWDTLRKKRVIVLGNNPVKREVDRSLMVLSSMQIQTLSLNKSRGVCMVKPLKLQTNPDSGKTYRHRLHVDGFEIHRCWSGKPNDELTVAYEQLKDDFLDDLYDRLEKKHEDKREKKAGELLEKIQVITPLESRRARMRGRGLTNTEIGKMEGVSDVSVIGSLQRYDRKLKKILEMKTTSPSLQDPPQLNM